MFFVFCLFSWTKMPRKKKMAVTTKKKEEKFAFVRSKLFACGETCCAVRKTCCASAQHACGACCANRNFSDLCAPAQQRNTCLISCYVLLRLTTTVLLLLLLESTTIYYCFYSTTTEYHLLLKIQLYCYCFCHTATTVLLWYVLLLQPYLTVYITRDVVYHTPIGYTTRVIKNLKSTKNHPTYHRGTMLPHPMRCHAS